MPAKSVDFTTFAWPSLLKRLRQMLVTGHPLEEGIDWSLQAEGSGRGRHVNRSLGALLTLRGKGAERADCSLFEEPWLYAGWSPSPLLVASSPAGLGRYEMAAALLSNCQSGAAPVARSLGRAEGMLAAGAFVHQYAAHGVERGDLEAAFARAEDVVETYRQI